jgi:hypothetical protein
MASPTGDSTLDTAHGEAMNDSDRIIGEAIKAIIDATVNPMHASSVIKLLKEKLKRVYGDADDNADDNDTPSESGDENEDGDDDPLEYPATDDDVPDDATVGEWKVESHKKSDGDKWRELIVFPAMR